MELHFMERLLNYLKLTFIYMAKRGLVKRGKLLSKTLLNLILHHQNHHFKTKKHLYPTPLTLRDYEFSCSNSPNPMLVKVRSKIRSSLFSCFNGGSSNAHHEHCFSRNHVYEPNKRLVSPYMITVSGYSSDEEEEGDDHLGLGFGNDVDYRAEKFIESFYEQLRAQNLGNNFILYGVDGHSF
ncbi:hypothetical protein LUZ62_027252 [Rhynchospora pubera]|uniref:Uncharacterized protein n=1 Tax=Rhynchospora pubera TaxID=906938 RepID=A0AAV8HEQ8_9POAL|nr:hypothetical protein LUZ62_027252 [Rhynchospora pubera]